MVCRIRNIKPSFFEDETVAGLPPIVRLFYIGLWTRSDLQGVFEWAPKVLAGLFPFDDTVTGETVTFWLDELVKLKRVRSYVIGGKRYGCITAFVEHQAISKSERDKGPQYPVIPVKTGTSRKRPKNVPETSDLGRMTSDLGRGTPDKGPRTKDEGQGTPEKKTAPCSGPFGGAMQGRGKPKDPIIESGEAELARKIAMARAMQAEREKEWETDPTAAEAITKETA